MRARASDTTTPPPPLNSPAASAMTSPGWSSTIPGSPFAPDDRRRSPGQTGRMDLGSRGWALLVTGGSRGPGFAAARDRFGRFDGAPIRVGGSPGGTASYRHLICNARVTCMPGNVMPLERGRQDDTASLWRALADPTRRRILDLLRQRPLITGEIAAQF